MLSQEHQSLKFMLHIPGWELLKAALGERQKEMIATILSPKASRKDTIPDDYIRGYVQGMLDMAMWPQQEVEEAERRDTEETKLVDKSNEYEYISDMGYSTPLGPPQEVISGTE